MKEKINKELYEDIVSGDKYSVSNCGVVNEFLKSELTQNENRKVLCGKAYCFLREHIFGEDADDITDDCNSIEKDYYKLVNNYPKLRDSMNAYRLVDYYYKKYYN